MTEQKQHLVNGQLSVVQLGATLSGCASDIVTFVNSLHELAHEYLRDFGTEETSLPGGFLCASRDVCIAASAPVDYLPFRYWEIGLAPDAGRYPVNIAVWGRQLPDALIEAITERVNCAQKTFFSGEEKIVAKLNPLLNKAVSNYKSNLKLDPVVFRNTKVVIRDHALLEKYNLVRSLLELGMPPSNIMFIPKGDRCLFREKVIGAFVSLGVHVVDPGAETFWKLAVSKHILPSESAVFLDDGGELLLTQTNPSGLRVLIETTSRGIQRLAERGFSHKVIDLAHCDVKKKLSKAIAGSVIVRLRSLLSHHNLLTSPVVLVGYGALGRSCAEILRAMGGDPLIVEIKKEAREAALSDGFRCFECVKDALCVGGVRVVLGCSGEQVLGPDILPQLAEECFFASVSSQDCRPLIKYLDTVAQKTVHAGWGSIYALDGKRVHVLGEGDALNLYYSEGVSEPEFDSFTALMLVGVVEGARGLFCAKQSPLIGVTEVMSVLNQLVSGHSGSKF